MLQSVLLHWAHLSRFAGVLVFLGLGIWAAAQSVTATLVGTVVDPSGAAVPGTKITLTNKGTDVARIVQSNERGDYIIPNLAPGRYQLTGEREGFRRTVVAEIELMVNQTARVDVSFQVGDLAETVDVTSTAPLVQSETSSVGQVIEPNLVADLPLNGRVVFNLTVLSPATVPTNPSSYVSGVRGMPGGLGTPAFSVGGGRDNGNGYLVDGVEALDPHYMTPSMSPPMDSIQEFKVQSNSQSAEFGHFSVQVNASTKSGTNELHGSAYDYLRNDALDAANFFDNFGGLRKAPLRYNLFGGTLGGPITLPRLYRGRGRTFFFVNYEGVRIRTSRTAQLAVPTPEQRNGDFSRLGFRGNQPIFDPATTRPNPAGSGVIRDPFAGNVIPAGRATAFAKGVLGFFPAPTAQSAVGNNFFATLGNISDNNQLVIRGDHSFSASTSLFFRYYFFNGLLTNRSAIQNDGETNNVRNQNMALGVTHSFRADTLYELRLGYNRPKYYLLQAGANTTNYAQTFGLKNLLNDPIVWGIPNVTLSSFSSMGLQADPNNQLSNVYQIVNHLSLIRGAHNLKVGADLRKTNYNDRGERNARGKFDFTGALTADPQRRAGTGVSAADLLLGLPLTVFGANTTLAGNFNAFQYYFFFQDDWKVSSRVTLNLGVRYEVNTPFVDVQNRISFFDRSYPGGRVLLAGTSKAFIPPLTFVDAPPTPRGLFPADKNDWMPRVGLAFRPFRNNRTAIRIGYGFFYTMVDGQATRQLERNPPASSVISLAANQDANSSGPDAIRIADLFPAQGALAARPQVWSDIGRRPLPYVQQWNFSAQQSLTANTVLEVSYLGSKGTHLPSYAQGNQARLDANPSRPTPLISRQPFPLWGSELRTTVLSDSTYHAGFIKVERRLVRGFSLLAHYTLSKSLDAGSDINQSLSDFYNLRSSKGRSLSDIRHYSVIAVTWEPPVGPGKRFLTAGILSQILGSWKANSVISIRGGFPYSPGVQGDVCNCSAYSQRPQLVGDPRSGFTQSREKWFNTAAFVAPVSGTLGNAGRGILTGPGSTTVAFSLFRIINIKEKTKLQFRAEFFNFFNKTNFGNPGATVGSTSYGVITSAAAPRVVQLALKLQF